jgi:F-type H+-transporting ATPase subunit b
MPRLRYSVFLLIAGLALPVAAADAPKKAGGADAHAGHDHGKPPIYEVAGHDEKGNHVVRTFNLAIPAEAAAFREMVEHGHAHEVVNKSAPTIDKLASLKADLGIWTLVIFGGLMFALYKLAWPMAVEGLKKREDRIAGALAEAEKARAEAVDLRASLKKEMDAAHLKVKELIDEAKRDAQATTDEMIAKAKSDINVERERLQREIQTQTDQALQSLWARAADLATELSSTALRKQLDLSAHRRLIDEALTDIRKARPTTNAS